MILRKARLQDADVLAQLMLLAMKDIVYRFIGEQNPEKAKNFLLHFIERENNQYSYQNCWVAEVAGNVVALANVYNGARLPELRQPVINFVRTHYQPNFNPEPETQPGEYYLDTLAVFPDWQCHGIGTAFLLFLIDTYVVKGRNCLGLLVDDQNHAAEKLYLKLGFTIAGHKTLVGKRLKHLQIGQGN